MSILDGFEALGSRTRMAVGQKRTADPRVVPFYMSPHIDYRPYAKRHRRAALAISRAVDRRLGLEDFRHPYTRHTLELTGTRPDLVICQNLHGGYFDLRALSWMSQQVPVVMRLSDSWTFTGHCASPLGCQRWETGCGACPDLAIPPVISRDATRFNWRRKRRILGAAHLGLVAPCEWMLQRGRRSLFGPDKEWVMIRGGINLDIFSPGSRQEARRSLDLSADTLVLLFVANGGSANPYKDFSSLRAGMQLLAVEDPPLKLRLIIVGREGPEERIGANAIISHLSHCTSPIRLRDFYRAADVYVHSSWEETGPQVIMEALACGVPVVTTDLGGPPEIVDHGVTGLVVPAGHPGQMASALKALLSDPARRGQMGEAAAESARARFDIRRQVAELHAWCADFALRWQNRAEADQVAEPFRTDDRGLDPQGVGLP